MVNDPLMESERNIEARQSKIPKKKKITASVKTNNPNIAPVFLSGSFYPPNTRVKSQKGISTDIPTIEEAVVTRYPKPTFKSLILSS